MIYFLSDLHGDMCFPGIKEYIDNATDNDLLIILGDIGLNFEKTKENEKFTEWFLSLNKNIAILDGNHENFEYLNSFPTVYWNGGNAGRLSENIVLLRRGNIYTINGKTFFAFGGCKSSSKWAEMDLWYPGEEPSPEEIELAHFNLKKHNYCVDYILTHKYENPIGGGKVVCEELRKLTAFIEDNVNYTKWYYGHGHANKILDEKHMMMYDELISLENDLTD